MSLIVLDGSVVSELRSLKDYGDRNKYSLDELFDLKNGRLAPPGEDPNFFRIIGLSSDVKVVYTVEQQPTCMVMHLSVSQDGKVPEPMLVRALLGIFDMEMDKCVVHLGEPGCVNLLQPIN